LIEKKSKNNILWKGGSLQREIFPEPQKRRTPDYTSGINQLTREEKELDQQIALLQAEVEQLHEKSGNLIYVEYGDVRKLPSMQDQTIIAVRAVPGTTLEVPEPDSGERGQRKYEMYLRSEEPIDVYVVSEQETVGTQEGPTSNNVLQSPMKGMHDGQPGGQNLVELPMSDYLFNTGGPEEGLSDYLMTSVGNSFLS